MKKIIKGDICEIKWRDSNIYMTQCEEDDDFNFATIVSVGQFVMQDEEKVVIAGDILSDGDLRRVIVIPQENVIEIN